MHSAILLAIAALPFLGVEATYKSNINLTARCGTQTRNGASCLGSVFGNCCSKNGLCGRSAAFCGTGCQVGFGECTIKKPFSTSSAGVSTSTKLSTSAAIPSTSTKLSTSVATPSTSVIVPVTPTSISLTPSAPSTTPDVVTVTPTPVPEPSPSSSSAPAASSSSTPDVKVSVDGSCGGSQGYTCAGSVWGNCCSEYGFCGASSIYCDAGCNAAFGVCGSGVSSSVEPPSTPTPEPSSSTAETPSSFTTLTRTSSSAAPPAPTQVISTTGACGTDANGLTLTCLGSEFGDCCSQYGYCGRDPAFCSTGCNPLFGTCTTTPPPTPSGPTCGVEGFAAKEAYYASSFNLVPATDVSTCAALCLAEAECKSYLFNPKLGNCAYLPQTLAQGEFIATGGTDQLFWERECAETGVQV